LILDSSAILAILLGEPDGDSLLDRLQLGPIEGPIGVGAPTLFETALVLTSRLGWGALNELEEFLQDLSVVVVPFGESHWLEALEAHRRFGKGRHPAALNFGDCLAYAVAKIAREPLLFVGNDFARTDLNIADIA
jgi:ribonuclease VapC